MSKEEKDRAQEILTKKKATIVEDEASASHIIYPSTDLDNEAFCKAIFKRGEKCLVHFYRMPESHDNWGTV